MKDTVTVPDAREVFDAATLQKFGRLVEQRSVLKATIKQCEEDTKALDAAITSMLTEHDAPAVQHGTSKVALCSSSRSTLSKERLVELGVPGRIIQEATTVTTYSYLKVTEH